MLIKNCEFCGGELEVNADMSVGVCKYCDSINVIPKELERKGRLYNRAVFLRQNKDFDKALSVYEEILKEDNSDADAHWGLILSKYGIEYVLDSRTGKRIPTCHRTQSDPILSDPDYLATIENADIEAKRVIEAEAKKISEIQKRILEISQNEPPYDVFICYKETDESGKRTEDSILAQDLYYELEKKGYKVFFARKTLESKLGAEYEPIIFAALNTSKVMIVVGTKAEHFNAVWVRNEWSRFLKMSHNSSKVIIPAYRGISPYELPDELSILQSQDMSKLGFMQDLTDGIDKILQANSTPSTSSIQKSTVESFTGSLDRLLQNGETYLKLNDYNRAKEVYTKITQEYPESYQGWWGLIVCDTNNFSALAQNQGDVDIWFDYVKKLSLPETFAGLKEQYIDYLKIVANNDAKQDILAARNRVNILQENISDKKASIAKFEQEIKTNQVRLDNELDVVSKQISTITMSLGESSNKAESQKAIGIFFVLAGIAASGFTIFLIWDIIASNYTGFIKFIAWVFAIFVGCGALSLFGYSADHMGKSSSHEKKTNEGHTRIADLEKQKETLKANCNSKNQAVQKRIAKENEEIEKIKTQISECMEYIDLPEENVSSFFYANKIKIYGVDQPVDDCVLELRKKVIGESTGFNNSDHQKQPILPKIEKREDIIEGEIYSATVTKIMQFGAFVKIDNSDFEGLIHISKLSLDKNIRFKRIEDAVSVGDAVDVLIEQIDSVDRISCALVSKNTPQSALKTTELTGVKIHGKSYAPTERYNADVIISHIQQGNKLEAIRIIREWTGLGLQEGKEVIETWPAKVQLLK